MYALATRLSWLLLVAGALLGTSTESRAQITGGQRPSPEEAEALLRARPDLVAQLRARLQASGLSPAQIRARLQAEGYPSTLLDAYLTPGTGNEVTAAPTEDVLSAVRALGVVDSLEVDSLRYSGLRRLSVAQIDSVLRAYADSADVDYELLEIRPDALPAYLQDLIQRRTDLLRAEHLARSRVDSGHRVFGLDLFRNRSTLFDANLAGPVDPSYRLGPGDRLVLILTGDVEAAHTLDVTREGFVVIPQVGRIDVANLSLAQLEDLLYASLSRVYSGVRRGPGATTRFSISVARLRVNQVYVFGDVAQPGSYRISSAGTVMSALYAAGGPSENGSFRSIEVRRGTQVAGRLDLYDYLLGGSSASDIRLENGDVVFVPPRGGRVRIWGEVVRPGTYEVREGESLGDLVRAAGGLTATADHRRVQVERILPAAQRNAQGSDRIVMDVSSADLATGTASAVPVHPGDVVRVFPVSSTTRSRVSVVGNVWSPGTVGFTPGMRLSNALRLAGGLKPDSYLEQVLITRVRPDSTHVQIRAGLADTTGRAVDDLTLEDGDQIQVFSLSEFRPRRYVVMSGAVRRSGRYPYREGMTLRDLLLMAGGPLESAILAEAEVARIPENRAAGVTAVSIRVPLGTRYLLDPTSSVRVSQQGGLPETNGDFVLRPYDHVLIFREPNWTLQRTVVITGEVRFPGRYSLQTKNERLVDLIKRAGGLTTEAYPAGIVFVRSERGLGRIGLDLPAALRRPGHRDNLLLVDGDSISIPVFSNVVNVRGSVNSPVAVAYVPGRNIDYYINAAGGSSRRGDLRGAFVTQPNGKVESRGGRGLFPGRKPVPQPGGVVYVPELDDQNRRDGLQTMLAAAQVLGSLAAILAVARTF